VTGAATTFAPAEGGAAPRTLVIMRHGLTEDNLRGIYQGHRDSELSRTGWAQARFAALVVAEHDPTIIVSSDLRRAADTADVVADLLGMRARRDPRLREIDVGEWGGRNASQVWQTDAPTLAAIAAGHDVPRGRTGETVAELAVRARAAADDVVAALPPGRTALLVCHGLTSRALVASLVGLDQMAAVTLLHGLGNCRWATISQTRRATPDGRPAPWRIDEWNTGAGSRLEYVVSRYSDDLGRGPAIG